MLFLHPAHHHTKMARLNYHAHSLWLNHFLNGLGNLGGESLLDLQTAGKDLDQPRDFAQADDFTVRNVGDMDFAKEREHMMLTEAKHFHIFDNHHLVIADGK